MKKLQTLLFMLAAFVSVHAQKLPNVQHISLRAPANVKVDGKLTEWGAQLQAHNNATNVDYTLSNDDKNLYLALSTKGYFVIENIHKHGIRLTINHSTSKKDDSPVVITYPALAREDGIKIGDLMASRFNEGAKQPVNNSAEALNGILKSKSKFIKVEGISDIMDKQIPVYNDKGINAVTLFAKQQEYVYELAIPLKYLSLNDANPSSFSYQIKINFPDPNEKRPPSPPPPPGVIELQPIKESVAVTDFWGEYTLVK